MKDIIIIGGQGVLNNLNEAFNKEHLLIQSQKDLSENNISCKTLTRIKDFSKDYKDGKTKRRERRAKERKNKK